MSVPIAPVDSLTPAAGRVRTASRMSDTARKILGGVLAIACLAVAAVVSSQLATSARNRAEDEARAAAVELLGPAEAKLTADRDALERVARAGGERLNQALAQLSPEEFEKPDGPPALARTIEDILVGESWWGAFRATGTNTLVAKLPLNDGSGGMEWSVVGDVPAEAREGLIALAEKAEVATSASGFALSKDLPQVAAAVRLNLPATQHQQYVLVMEQAITMKALAAHASALNAAIGVVGPATPVTAGSETDEGALKRFLAATPAPGAATACCATRELAPGLQLVVARDPAPRLALADAAGQRSRVIAFAVAGVLALLLLIVTFRRGGSSEQERLLRETAAQLQAQQEALQRLSQQISNPNIPLNPGAAATGAAHQVPVDDALAATSASVVQSRYETVAPLGQGGMAQVSVAVVRGAEGFRRLFVVKRLRPELAGTPELVNQFIDEARLGASLVHSNVVPVFDFGRDADGYYMAQEYILGRDVDAVVQASMKKRGRALEAPLVLAIAQEALKALAYAHSKTDDAGRALGLVHRDVSPNNLMLSARGELKLLDFGIVKSEQRLTKTQTGIVKGNLFFMSPEQAKGLPLDLRSDLFSLGLVLFYAATGETLYAGGSSYELLTRAAQGIGEADVARVKALGEPLAGLLLKALQFDPHARYLDADDFARAVAATGQVASAADLKLLMETVLKDELAEEQGRFAVREGA